MHPRFTALLTQEGSSCLSLRSGLRPRSFSRPPRNSSPGYESRWIGWPNAPVFALVAGMIAGADSIQDMDLLRHGGMTRLFTDVRAPSTLGTFLRVFTFGHVRELDAVAAALLARLSAVTPILAGAATVAFVDIDDTVRQTYGYAKRGAGRGYSGVKGLNALLATISTPLSAPVIATTPAAQRCHQLRVGRRETPR